MHSNALWGIQAIPFSNGNRDARERLVTAHKQTGPGRPPHAVEESYRDRLREAVSLTGFVRMALVVALCWLPCTTTAQVPPYEPPGVSPGETYHLVFVTSATGPAFYQDILLYNGYVQDAANNSTLGMELDAITWYVVGSTKVTGFGDAEAKDNAQVIGDVYRVDGVQVTDESGAARFYQSEPFVDHLAAINIDENGGVATGFYVWTGSNADGTRSSYPLGEDTTYRVTNGAAAAMNASWINHASITPASTSYKFYALSEPLVGGSGPIPVPEPPPQLLSRGHQILLERGFQIQALSYPGASDFDADRWAESNFTTVHCWQDYADPPHLPNALGLPLWSSWIYHGLGFYQPGVDRYPHNLEEADSRTVDYADSLVSVQFGDEQGITEPAELARLKSAMEAWHVHHPNVLTYTNQGPNQGTPSELKNYMQEVQPDLLFFDNYAFRSSQWMYPRSPTALYRNLETYRKLSLAGNDGTGSRPIPFGLWTQASTHQWVDYHVVSESELRLNNFAALAFGVKVLDALVYEHPVIGGDEPPAHPHVVEPVLFEGTGTANPTPLFYQTAESNRQIRNLGSTLVQLVSTDVRMIMGQYKEGDDTEEILLPPGVRRWSPSADPYITSITATNLGSTNNGLPGDVILGYFKLLDAAVTSPGEEDDLYFLVVNGLSDIDSLSADTEQQIHLELDFGASGIDSLQRFSRDTGRVQTVALANDGGSLRHLDWVLEGGTGDLFKFTVAETGTRFQLPGDCNQDGDFDLSDVICLLGHLFQGSPESLPCLTAAASLTLMDGNGDGSIDISDAVYTLAFLFQGGPSLSPGVDCFGIPDCPENQGCP